MKAFVEEYGYIVIAVVVGLLIVSFVVKGLGTGGFLEVLTRCFSKATFG